MKKIVLSTIVTATLLWSGNVAYLAPLEPAIQIKPNLGWDFSGEAVIYMQTEDSNGKEDLFTQASNKADTGLQLTATHKDIYANIGVSIEASGITTLGTEHAVVSDTMEHFGSKHKGGWISQAYLTYALDKTQFKLGRFTLSKTLSPFYFSEGWNVFKNTFDAMLITNTDLSQTTLMGAWLLTGNSYKNMDTFSELNHNNGLFMFTAQNQSFERLILTGTYYYGSDLLGTENANILWGDAKFAISDYSIALQGGTILGADDAGLGEDTTAYGAKVGADFGMFDASVAYSSVDEGAVPIVNRGTLVKTPLYTQMILNQGVISTDADYIKAGVTAKALGGKFIANYGYAINNEDTIEGGADNNPAELDLIYKTKILNGSTTLLAAYVMIDPDKKGLDNNNVIRVWGRYNF